jgi:hypothetical protein
MKLVVKTCSECPFAEGPGIAAVAAISSATTRDWFCKLPAAVRGEKPFIIAPLPGDARDDRCELPISIEAG